jgi:hypothetical protein
LRSSPHPRRARERAGQGKENHRRHSGSERLADREGEGDPYHGKVASVDLGAKTFMIGKRTFKVTDQTQIHKEGAAATISYVAPGEKVSGSCWKKDNGTLEAKSVNSGPR